MNEIKDVIHLYNALNGYKQKLEKLFEVSNKSVTIRDRADLGMYERLFSVTINTAKDYPVDITGFERWWEKYRISRIKIVEKDK